MKSKKSQEGKDSCAMLSKEPGPKKDRDIFSVQKRSSKKKGVQKAAKGVSSLSDGEEEALAEMKQLAANTKAHKKKFHNFLKQGLKVSYEDMNIGSLVGCCVTRVFTDRICVTLPHRMKGYIPLTHISAQYTSLMQQLAEGQTTSEAAHTLPELYRPGQFLTASVAAPADDSVPAPKQKQMGLALSLYPSDVHGSSVSAAALRSGCVLQCSVTACEDHGYTLDTGVRGVSAAFLPEKDVLPGTLLAVGCVLPCSIVSLSGDHTSMSLTLSALTDTVNAAVSKPTEDKKYDLMLPGTAVACVVSESTADGLSVYLGSEEGYYSSLYPEESELPVTNASQRNVGIISTQHLRGPFDQCHLFRVGQKLSAKVMLVTTMPRVVHLTLNKSLFNNCLPAEEDPQCGLVVNSIVEGASVVNTSPLGVSLRLSNKCKGFCFVSKLPTALKPRKLAEKYKAGLKVSSCKLLHFNPFDQVFIVSLKKEDVIEEQDATELLDVGQVVPVKIDKHLDGGAIVKYEPSSRGGRKRYAIEGFVPRLHLTDTNMSNPSLRYPVGRIVKARVLDIRNDLPTGKHKLTFTLKTLLVQSDLKLVKEYSEDCIGEETEGVVTKVKPDKVFVQFIGNTVGLLHASEFSGVGNLSEAYEVGSVLRVRIKGIGKLDPPVYFLALLSRSSNSRKRKLGHDFDPVAEGKKLLKKNKQEPWLKSLKSVVAASTDA